MIIKLDKDYEFNGASMDDLCNIEDELGCSISGLPERLQERQLSTIRSILYALLKDRYPVTKKAIGKSLTVENLKTLADQILEILKDAING